MALEIERKFLVRSDAWRPQAKRSVPIRQGYFCRTPLLRGRIRIFGDKGFVTLKSEAGTLVRHEFEYEIPMADALEIIQQFSIEPGIAKTRHEVMHEDVLWTVDVFEGLNAGLILAEVELDHREQAVAIPAWAGQEVTGDRRFDNSNLARFPFTRWEDDRAASTTGGAL